MDDIASIVGMKNADSVITKKTKCMAKFKEIGKMLIENDEFPEEDILWIVMFLVSSNLQFQCCCQFDKVVYPSMLATGQQKRRRLNHLLVAFFFVFLG